MAILLPITLGGCQLLGGSTQVRFNNATSAFTLASIQLGSLTYNSPLSSGSMTGYYAVSPGPGNAYRAKPGRPVEQWGPPDRRCRTQLHGELCRELILCHDGHDGR